MGFGRETGGRGWSVFGFRLIEYGTDDFILDHSRPNNLNLDQFSGKTHVVSLIQPFLITSGVTYFL